MSGERGAVSRVERTHPVEQGGSEELLVSMPADTWSWTRRSGAKLSRPVWFRLSLSSTLRNRYLDWGVGWGPEGTKGSLG